MEIHTDYPLDDLNTFHVAARAERYVRFDRLDEVAPWLRSSDLAKGPRLILGGGSNLLFVGNVGGTVLHPILKGIECLKSDKQHVWVRAMAGEGWDDLVAHCVANGWGGVENLSLIPGSVGASVIQNIGAYGVEVDTVIERVEALTLPDGDPTTFSAKACGFGYRQSNFKTLWQGRHLITAVVYKLQRTPRFILDYAGVEAHLKEIGPPSLANVRQAVINLRKSKLPDPSVVGNAGSFFKNPTVTKAVLDALLKDHPALPHYSQGKDHFKVAAGWLIDQCGWKGRSIGDAGVHDRQALVLVNHGTATGEEILDLANRVAQAVEARFAIRLEREVRVVKSS